MKNLFLHTSVWILCGISFAGKAQYLGGNADGFAYKSLIASACPAQANSNIYFGGTADGSASNKFIVSACPAQLNSNIYFGGTADGSASKSLIVTVCPPQLSSNVFYGGIADGFAYKSLIVTVCPPQSNTNVFYGATADGFAYKSLIATVCPPQPNSNIYYGGVAMGAKAGQLIAAPCAVLPIELIAFTGVCEKQKINLKWSTATEINNNYFTIENSNDGINWATIGRVEGAGNSTTLRNYSFTDTSINKTVVYYRLMQTDFNGNYKYWNIIIVEKCISDGADISIYPNTSSGKFNLMFTGDKNSVYSTEVFNSLGEKIYTSPVFQSKLDLSDKPSGVYYLHLNTPSKSLSTKVVIEQ